MAPWTTKGLRFRSEDSTSKHGSESVKLDLYYNIKFIPFKNSAIPNLINFSVML